MSAAPSINLLREMQDRNRYLARRVEALEKALAVAHGRRCERCDTLPEDCRCDPCQKFLDSFVGIPTASNDPPPPSLAERAKTRLHRALRKIL